MGDNMPSISSSYVRTISLYGDKGESAEQEECFCTFPIIDEKILQPAGSLYVDVVAMASLRKWNCRNVCILASICQEISWTFSESKAVLLQSLLCCFTSIYLLKHFAPICVSLTQLRVTLNSQLCRRYSERLVPQLWKAHVSVRGAALVTWRQQATGSWRQ